MRTQKRTIQKWCDALRGGEYKQDRKTLQTQNGFCCLGVACKVFIPRGKLAKMNSLLGGELPNDQRYSPNWLKDINDDFNDKTRVELTMLNDSGNYNFNEIADLLEAVYIHKVL